MYNDYPTIYETNINQYMIYYIILAVVLLAILVFTMISLAKIYRKANRSGISAIIPIYNYIVLLEITNLPTWYFILLLIPGVNIIVNVFIMMELARLFRKSKAFGLGLTFLPFIFYPILAFNNSEYVGLNLVAKEQKSTVVELPKVINEEEKPVVNEDYDDKNRNINISIGGGVYQKDYTNTLLNLDEKQVIVDKSLNDNNSISEINNTFLNLAPDVDDSANKDVSIKDNSYIEFVSNDVMNKENGSIGVNINHSNLQSNNKAADYIICPGCGARIKSGASICFLCGKTFE